MKKRGFRLVQFSLERLYAFAKDAKGNFDYENNKQGLFNLISSSFDDFTLVDGLE